MHNIVSLKTAAPLVVLLLLSMPAIAQPGPGPGGRRQMTEEDVKERVRRTADSLDLTEDQEKKVLAFELEFFRKNQEMFQDFDFETGDREAMREYMGKQREERDQKYAEVLTDEQMQKYREMRDRMRQNMRRRMEDDSGGRGRGRGRG